MAASTPPPAAPPAGGGSSGTATLGVRFGARLLDGLIIGIPVAIVLFILGLSESYVANALVSLGFFAYYVYFESTTGATLGKRILNLRVVAADGTPPALEAAAKRNSWMLLGLLPTFLGGLLSLVAVIVIAVTISSSPHHRGKHDEFAGTGVLR